MGLKSSLKKGLKKKDSSINTRVRICVECGSMRVSLTEKSIKCLDCGKKKSFKKILAFSAFKKGDHVKIIDVENTDTIYKVKKMKKSEEGTPLYLLKSDSRNISLLYYESSDSHLEKVES
jgi:hypothetical protein